MGKLGRAVAKGARKAYEKVETKFLVAQGRKAVRDKARNVSRVTKKAAKRGLMIGGLAAAAVVLREIRKSREG
jgi:hypothetical protein